MFLYCSFVRLTASSQTLIGKLRFGEGQYIETSLLEAGLVEPDAVRAVVASETSAAALRQAHHGLDVDTDPGAAWAAPVVLLAVKPQQLDLAVQAAAGGSGGLLVSVLAGVTLERLQRLFPQRQCVRAVPNTPALVRAGLTGLAFGADVDPGQRRWVEQLFAQVGEVHELPEPQLDAFLALTSSGPAFVAVVAEALADGAVAAGLPRLLAQRLTHRTGLSAGQSDQSFSETATTLSSELRSMRLL